MEFVGALASVTQVVHYGIEIISMISEIRQTVGDSQQRYDKYERDITCLVDLARLIEKNLRVQATDNVCCRRFTDLNEAKLGLASHLSITVIKAQELQLLLHEETAYLTSASITRRYIRAAQKSRTKKFTEHFNALEDRRAALSFYIQVVQFVRSESLEQLQNTGAENTNGTDLADITRDMPPPKQIQYLRSPLQPEPPYTLSIETQADSANKHCSEGKEVATSIQQAEESVTKNETNSSHTFTKIVCRGDSMVGNGNTINPMKSRDNLRRTTLKLPVGSRHQYREITISDKAKVHNGNIGIGMLQGHNYDYIEANGGKVKNGDYDGLNSLIDELGR